MKLELKHLAGYLPYKVKVSKIHTLNIGNGIGGISHVLTTHSKNYKPILRPLSDLTKEIEVNGEKFVPIEILNELFEINGLENTGNGYMIYGVRSENAIIAVDEMIDYIEKLYEWHFDIHNLIKNGLAIDINTLN